MPYPRAGESEQEYVSRFMASPEAQRDYPDQKQRSAVAYSMFKERANAQQLCPEDGAEMVMGPEGSGIFKCTHCGLEQKHEPANIQGLEICPQCQDPLEQHDDIGCNLGGCNCVLSNAEIAKSKMGPEIAHHVDDKGMPQDQAVAVDYKESGEKRNATDKDVWKRLSQQERLPYVQAAGVSDTYVHVEQWDAIPDEIRQKIGQQLAKVPGQRGERPTENSAKMACPYCHSTDTLKTIDTQGGKFQFGSANSDAWECHSCEAVWATDPKTGAVQNAEANAFGDHAKHCQSCTNAYNADPPKPEMLCADGRAIVSAKETGNAEDPTLRRNREEHAKELAEHEKTLEMAKQSGSKELIERAQALVDDAKRKIAAADAKLGEQRNTDPKHKVISDSQVICPRIGKESEATVSEGDAQGRKQLVCHACGKLVNVVGERGNAAGWELAKKLGVKHPKDLPFDQPNPLGCNGCDAIKVPLNADGYCKECASKQGAYQFPENRNSLGTTEGRGARGVEVVSAGDFAAEGDRLFGGPGR